VRPWRTSVEKITAKVTNSSSSRAGKSAGRASAAASETEPRMPAQPRIVRWRQPARRARWLSRRSSARIAQALTCTQASRQPITTSETTTAVTSSAPSGSPERPSTIRGSCRPISTNSSALSRKIRISHTEEPVSRMRTVEISGERQPT